MGKSIITLKIFLLLDIDLVYKVLSILANTLCVRTSEIAILAQVGSKPSSAPVQ